MVQNNNFSIGLTIFRVIICFIIIKNMCFYLPMADYLFGASGISPYSLYQNQMHLYGLQYLAYPFHLPYFSQLYLIAVIILASMYMVAIGKRYIGLLLYLSIIILKVRNGFILDGSDNVIQVTLPFLVLADNLKHFRYFKRDDIKTSPLMSQVSVIAAYGLMIQVCYVYLFTGLAKHEGELWRNGTAIYYTMRVRDFMATSWNIPLTENHYFVVISTYFTMFWELAFPFLIWVKRTKFFIMLGGVLLHVGIWIFMRIDNFSWVMIATYFVFITDAEYLQFQNWFYRKKLIVFVDGWCPNCRKFGNLVTRLDVLSLIEIKNIRNIEEGYNAIDTKKAVKIMASVNLRERSFYGFRSIYQIFIRLPVVWVLFPVIYTLRVSKIGDYLYDELAIRRRIIPLHCTSECNLNHSK